MYRAAIQNFVHANLKSITHFTPLVLCCFSLMNPRGLRIKKEASISRGLSRILPNLKLYNYLRFTTSLVS